MPTQDHTIPKSESWQMFNDISPRYDLLNRLLSLGLDHHWRHCLARFLPTVNNINILDLATGTADVLLTIVKYVPVGRATGLDLADKMLEIGRAKIEKQGLGGKIKLQHGDAVNTLLPDDSFDAVTMAFGIRNVPVPLNVLREMRRVLNKNGRALILEFSLPANRLLRGLHLFYLRTVVPAIGGMVSGHGEAYRYLNQTIEQFPYGKDFCRLMAEAGLKNVSAHPLLGGVATIYVGEK